MIFSGSVRPPNHGALLRVEFSAIIVLATMVGSTGCKKEEIATLSTEKNDTSAIQQPTDEETQESPSKSDSVRTPQGADVLPSEELPRHATASKRTDQHPVPAAPNVATSSKSAKTANSGTGRKHTPQEAIKAAKIYQQSASRFASQGKLEPAFKEAIEGWQAVRIHSTDSQCKQLAAKLLEDIQNYSDQLAKAAGGKAGMPDDSKPIRFE